MSWISLTWNAWDQISVTQIWLFLIRDICICAMRYIRQVWWLILVVKLTPLGKENLSWGIASIRLALVCKAFTWLLVDEESTVGSAILQPYKEGSSMWALELAGQHCSPTIYVSSSCLQFQTWFPLMKGCNVKGEMVVSSPSWLLLMNDRKGWGELEKMG